MNHTIWRTAAVLVTSGATILALGGTAVARPAPATATTVSGAAQERAHSYWTPERMRSAVPMDAPRVTGRPESVPTGTPAAIHAAAPRSFPNNGAPWTSGGAITASAGRVFFTYQGKNASCSGNAVTSGNKSTVITAGHCVKLGGAWHTNWTFVPGYDNGSAPHGTWTARALQATPQWTASENISYDIGAAVVNTLGGTYLTDAVGGQGIAFNQARKQNMYSFGYPAAAPYDGTRLVYCGGKASNEWLGTGDIGLACTMTGGASGGPWFLQFDESTGTGLLNSVNSFKYNFSPNLMFGPYFGDDAQNLYQTAQLA